MSLIQASISACEKGSQWIAAVQLLEDMVARRPGQILLGSGMGLFRIWTWMNLRFLLFLPVSSCSVFSWSPVYCLPDFLGAFCSFMFVYSSVSVCFLRWNASLPALGKATKQRRCSERSYQCLCQMLEVATCVMDPQADGGSRMSWFRANCENGLYDGRCCHQFLPVL